MFGFPIVELNDEAPDIAGRGLLVEDISCLDLTLCLQAYSCLRFYLFFNYLTTCDLVVKISSAYQVSPRIWLLISGKNMVFRCCSLSSLVAVASFVLHHPPLPPGLHQVPPCFAGTYTYNTRTQPRTTRQDYKEIYFLQVYCWSSASPRTPPTSESRSLSCNRCTSRHDARTRTRGPGITQKGVWSQGVAGRL